MTKTMSKILLEKLALEKMLDYKFDSTFWEEFSIAEEYGADGVKEHYDLVFEQWKDNLKFLTELVLVLNIKIFIWYGVDDSIGKMYDQLWKETDGYALETLKGDGRIAFTTFHQSYGYEEFIEGIKPKISPEVADGETISATYCLIS